jgi:transposase-like protein
LSVFGNFIIYDRKRWFLKLSKKLNSVKNKTENQVKICTTDGYCGYENVVSKTFSYNLKLNRYNVVHNRVNARKGEGFNYPIKRTHNNIRTRTKTFRGFHGNINSANAIMKGLEIYLNFIRKHLAIDCCPYELAIPELKLGTNKWLDLIKLSNINQNELTIK